MACISVGIWCGWVAITVVSMLWTENRRTLGYVERTKRMHTHSLSHTYKHREQLHGGGSTGEWLARYGPGAEREVRSY